MAKNATLINVYDGYVNEKLVRYADKLLCLFGKTRSTAVFTYILSIISDEERQRLHKALKKNFSSEELKKHFWGTLDEYISVPDDLDAYLGSLFRNVLREKPSIYNWYVQEFRKIISKKSARSRKRSELESRLLMIKDAFALSDNEIEILTFFYILEISAPAQSLFSSDLMKMDAVAKSVRLYCRFFGLTPQELRDVFKKDSPLIRSSLLVRKKLYSGKGIELSEHIVQFLAGIGGSDLSNEYLEKDRRPIQLALSDFTIPAENIEIMREMLQSKKGSNLLLMGVPGTGKTELARTLAHSLGFETVLLRQTDSEGNEDLEHRKTGLAAAQNLLKKRKCVLIVDECDPLVNTYSGLFACHRDDSDGKSWINHYLERSELKTIWITNHVDGIDESTRRRFSYVQDFKRPVQRQRLKAWSIQAAKQRADFLDEETLERLSAEYTVSPGTIELALRDVQAMAPKASKEQKLSRLENILDKQQLFCVGRKKLAEINTKYSLDGLNTDVPPERVLRAVQSFHDRLQQGLTGVRNLNVLLMGPPGTGKTEFVKYLAKQSNRELLVKRTSDLVSAYLGESEKNIAKAFTEAEGQGAILFMDEADSLFINRDGANRSWEVSQTNELLCQMENFAGTLICATNFSDHMDPAVMRRFTFKVKFNYLKPEANLLFFKKTLAPLLREPLTEEMAEKIKRIRDLAPGDFKVVYQKFVFEHAASTPELIAALECEVRSRNSSERRIIGLGQGT